MGVRIYLAEGADVLDFPPNPMLFVTQNKRFDLGSAGPKRKPDGSNSVARNLSAEPSLL